VILILAIIAGLVAGVARAKVGGRRYSSPDLRLGWLLFVAVFPQLFSFHLPGTAEITSDKVAAGILVSTQISLLIFVWANRHLPGFWMLGLGLLLNFLVIVSNGGLMPISPETIYRLSPDAVITAADYGTRLGSSKDILLSILNTNFWILSDCLVLPNWIPYRVAFSIGDILIAAGVFWLLWVHGNIDYIQARFLRSPKLHTN
jgi:hypothetical protein